MTPTKADSQRKKHSHLHGVHGFHFTPLTPGKADGRVDPRGEQNSKRLINVLNIWTQHVSTSRIRVWEL